MISASLVVCACVPFDAEWTFGEWYLDSISWPRLPILRQIEAVAVSFPSLIFCVLRDGKVLPTLLSMSAARITVAHHI